jgi:dimethylhistidine N-methyltransferase
MSASIQPQLSPFALEVLEGLSAPRKKLSPQYFYDDLGSALFEAITLLPEYGLTRAEERLLRMHGPDVARRTGAIGTVAELGSGNGKKTKRLLESLRHWKAALRYRPIDVSQAALAACERELETVCEISPVRSDWLQGIQDVAQSRRENETLLVLFLGSSIGNLDRVSIPKFLRDVRSHLRPGDFFLLGADLAKDISRMIAAYDDPTGVTAAFNLNLLGRINGDLDADFDLRSFAHEVRWDPGERRIEMHLLSCRDQRVRLGALNTTLHFVEGETIWTESSHKFTCRELNRYAEESGFTELATWVDREWPFAETLWKAS